MRCYVIIRYASEDVACHGVIGVLFGLLATIFIPLENNVLRDATLRIVPLCEEFLQIIVLLDVKRPMQLKICIDIFVSGINALLFYITLFIALFTEY